MIIRKYSKITASNRVPIFSEDDPTADAETDSDFGEESDFGGSDFGSDYSSSDYAASFQDSLEDIQDTVEDIQDTVEDIDQDDIDIEIDNNIDNHYIAECERCQGVFISAVIESEAKTKSIHGVCPLCDKESDQYLKWVVKAVE